MMSVQNENGPCDGQIPEDWELPELKNLTTINANCVHADFRKQSAPTPLVATLKILDKLSEQQYFEGLYPKMPMHLFSHLEEEGWHWDVQTNDDGSVIVTVRHNGDAP